MTDQALMRGDGWVRCAICGAFHTDPEYPLLAIDTAGQRWDVCKGLCAEEAGIEERRERPTPA